MGLGFSCSYLIGREAGGGSVSSGDGRDLLKTILLLRKIGLGIFCSYLKMKIGREAGGGSVSSGDGRDLLKNILLLR